MINSTSFSSFLKLPAELRLRIWEFACPSPRIVEIAWSSKARSLISLAPTPPILHACRESRHYHIHKYQNLTFGQSTQSIPVDFKQDTLYFGSGCKHLVPSGKSNPWVKQNRKVISDITSSAILKQHLSRVAFDYSFVIAMEYQEDGVRQLCEILGVMEKTEALFLVSEWEREEGDEESNCDPGLKFIITREVTERDRDLGSRRVISFLKKNEGKRKFLAERARLLRS